MVRPRFIALLLLAFLPLTAQAQHSINQRAVLVTGASTGIGRKITERLAAHGYFVYAGARKDADMSALNAIPGVRAVRLGVSLIDPGSYHSDIQKNEAIREGQSLEGTSRSMYQEPDDVAAAVEAALFTPRPKRRYMVVPNQEQAAWTINALLDQLVQLNEEQPYAYSRGKLIALLDDALARERKQRAAAH